MRMPDPPTSVLIVIVNYRTPELTINCLESLRPEVARLADVQVADVQVVVTDNNSGDDSVARIRQYLQRGWDGLRIELQPLLNNGGFAYGNNAAIRPRLDSVDPPAYVLLLNPDTILRPNALTSLVHFLNEHPDVGIVGSRLEHPDGSAECSAFRFPTVAGELDQALRLGPISRLLRRYVIAQPIPTSNAATDWVAGASMLIRRDVFDAIGLLDERYFMYFEEVDFCWRAHRAGWTCWYVPASRVVHLVGQSSGVTDTKSPRRRRPDYWFESRRRYLVRNLGTWRSVGCDLVRLVGLALWQLRCVIERRPNDDPPRLWFDTFRHSVIWKGFSS